MHACCLAASPVTDVGCSGTRRLTGATVWAKLAQCRCVQPPRAHSCPHADQQARTLCRRVAAITCCLLALSQCGHSAARKPA